MGRLLHYSVTLILVGLLAIPEADARGGGGGVGGSGGGGFHGGFAGPRLAGVPRVGTVVTRTANGTLIRRPGFVSHQPLAPVVTRGFQNRQPANVSGIGAPFNGFATGFPNTVPTQFQNGSPRWRNGWGNWGGPVVGGWAWPSDWGTGGYYGYAYPPVQQPPPPEPQVIVIREDGQGRMATAEAPADFSYVKGCHAIANGYHCDAPTATP